MCWQYSRYDTIFLAISFSLYNHWMINLHLLYRGRVSSVSKVFYLQWFIAFDLLSRSRAKNWIKFTWVTFLSWYSKYGYI